MVRKRGKEWQRDFERFQTWRSWQRQQVVRRMGWRIHREAVQEADVEAVNDSKVEEYVRRHNTMAVTVSCTVHMNKRWINSGPRE